jgi:hypothetical protein
MSDGLNHQPIGSKLDEHQRPSQARFTSCIQLGVKLSLCRWCVLMRNTRAILVGGLLAVGVFGLAKAGALDDGEAAYFTHDYAKAVRLLRPLAIGKAHLGLMYEHGYGAPTDSVMARMWLNLAVSRAPSLSMAVKLRDEVAAKMMPA